MKRFGLLVGASALAFGLAASPAVAVDLLVLSEDVPAGLNIDGAAISIPATQGGVDNLMEPLVYYQRKAPNDEGIGLFDFTKFESRLAESWTYDDKTLTWTFKLRRNVKGCGGATFNADDVVYTFARAKSTSGSAPIGWFLSSVASIDKFTPAVFGDSPAAKEAKKLGDEVKKIDDYTVSIRQAAPNKLLLPVLTIFGLMIFDKETMEKNATADDPWSHKYADNVNVPSFGPYCLEKWEKDKEFIVAANPDYYLGKAKIDRVVQRKVPQSANRITILRTGQAQLVERLNPKEFDSLRNVRGVKVGGVYGNENLFVHMNFKTAPFDNIKVRQAIAHAIPYDRIIREAYFGQAKPWQGQFPSSYPGYIVSKTQYPYDVAKAKQLLAEAGYPNGKGLEKFASAFELFYVQEKESTIGPTANIIRSALAEIGIAVKLNPLPQTQYGDRQLVKKDMPFALNEQEKPIGVDVGYGVQLFFVSAEKGGLNTMVNYSNAKVDDLFAKAIVEPDNDKRNAMLAEIQDQLMADVAWLPVVEWKTQWAFSDKVKGLTWHADNTVRFFDLELAN